MSPFTTHTGIAAALVEDNVDTDQIIPSREMKSVSKAGLGDGLFAGRRYRQNANGNRDEDPTFVLNRDEYRSATILLTGRNFGCGSSREHAVWALADFGFRAIVAASFGKIFRANCARNGLLAIELDGREVIELAERTARDPEDNPLTIDLEQQTIELEGAGSFDFRIDPFDRGMLLEGLDHVAYTLSFEDEIDRFIEKDRVSRPWAHR